MCTGTTWDTLYIYERRYPRRAEVAGLMEDLGMRAVTICDSHDSHNTTRLWNVSEHITTQLASSPLPCRTCRCGHFAYTWGAGVTTMSIVAVLYLTVCSYLACPVSSLLTIFLNSMALVPWAKTTRSFYGKGSLKSPFFTTPFVDQRSRDPT
jgi:hypothetical protein